jgi:hypothetical protein
MRSPLLNFSPASFKNALVSVIFVFSEAQPMSICFNAYAQNFLVHRF